MEDRAITVIPLNLWALLVHTRELRSSIAGCLLDDSYRPRVQMLPQWNPMPQRCHLLFRLAGLVVWRTPRLLSVFSGVSPPIIFATCCWNPESHSLLFASPTVPTITGTLNSPCSTLSPVPLLFPSALSNLLSLFANSYLPSAVFSAEILNGSPRSLTWWQPGVAYCLS